MGLLDVVSKLFKGTKSIVPDGKIKYNMNRESFNSHYKDISNNRDSKQSVLSEDYKAYQNLIGKEIAKEKQKRYDGTRLWFWPGAARMREDSMTRLRQLYHTLDHLDTIVSNSYQTAKAEFDAKGRKPADEDFYIAHKVSRDLHSIIYNKGNTIYATLMDVKERKPLEFFPYQAYLGTTRETDSYPDKKIERLTERVIPRALASNAYTTLCEAIADYEMKAQTARLGFIEQKRYEKLDALKSRWNDVVADVTSGYLVNIQETKLYSRTIENDALNAVSQKLDRLVAQTLNPAAVSEEKRAGNDQRALGMRLEHVGI